eukprot:GILI01013770.1.p1 GENE.GILI01013770.1~~GILI01013770.1.p1  ORF type:complete len:357 (+),score=97.71 GILI01013770.1:149-1219(+)
MQHSTVPVTETTLHLERHEVKPNTVEFPPSTLTFAFGNGMFPKLIKEITGNDLTLQLKALRAINQLFRKKEHVISAVQAGMVGALRAIWIHSEVEVRKLVTQNLVLLAEVYSSRQRMVQEYKDNIVILPEDDCEEVRFNSATVLWTIANTIDGRASLFNLAIVPILLQQVLLEPELSVKCRLMEAFHRLLHDRQALSHALSGTSIQDIHALLKQHPSSEVKWRAAQILTALSVIHAGKVSCIKDGVIETCNALITEESAELRLQAIATISSLTIINEGKNIVMEGQRVEDLILLLRDPDTRIVLNDLQLLSHIAEHSQGRPLLRSYLQSIEPFSQHSDPLIAKAAQVAVNVINWNP